MEFLSCHSIGSHCEYLNTLRLRLSVFEASYPCLVGADNKKIARLSLPRGEKERVLALRADILAHEVFFDSFVKCGEPCPQSGIIGEQYGSEARFLYGLMTLARDESGFLLIYLNRHGRAEAYAGADYRGIALRHNVKLAVDLFEHAYFTDYGFDKEKYLSKALSMLNLSRLK